MQQTVRKVCFVKNRLVEFRITTEFLPNGNGPAAMFVRSECASDCPKKASCPQAFQTRPKQ